MREDLTFDFSVNKEKNTILIKRDFAAPIHLVWEAWSTADIIDQWWAPEGWECKTKSMKFEEGGMRLYLMTGSNGEEHWGINTYAKIQIQEYFSGKDCFSDSEGNIKDEYPNSDYEITFGEKEGKTIITHLSTYSNLRQLEASLEYGFEDGMTKAFEGLDRILGKIK